MQMIKANWHAPSGITAGTSCRFPGFSTGDFAENNLGLQVGDSMEAVQKNRAALIEALKLGAEPFWLNQSHSNRCLIAGEDNGRDADAAISRDPNIPLVVMTADCLPITLCNTKGDEIAIIHAGWRGLASGIIENTLAKMQAENQQLLAWIGPAICQHCFETGDEVFQAFQQRYPFTESAFLQTKEKWHGNLPYLAELILQEQGVVQISQSKHCSFEENHLFYSYRRNPISGRMATLIWFKQ